LGVVDKRFFEERQWTYRFGDETYHSRFPDDEDDDVDFMVELVVRPGFLKYGDDKGENFEVCSPWIGAIVEISEKGSDALPNPMGEHSSPASEQSFHPTGPSRGRSSHIPIGPVELAEGESARKPTEDIPFSLIIGRRISSSTR
jgi:hypothetical protein